MNERKYREKIGAMLFEIDRILRTENLMPREMQKFFTMEAYLKNKKKPSK